MRPTSIKFKPHTSAAPDPMQTWGLPFSKPQLSGLTKATLRKYYGVIPIMAAIGTGLTFGVLAIIHTLKGPDIELARHKNPEPWNDYHDRQFKLLKVGRDYSEPGPSPKY